MIRPLVLGPAVLMTLVAGSLVSVPADAALHPTAAKSRSTIGSSRPVIDYMPTRTRTMDMRYTQGARDKVIPGRVFYFGGSVQTTPKAYLVVYGSQWKNNDPDKEMATVAHFLSGLAGATDTWSTIMTQYCQGAPIGAHSCGPNSTKIIHPTTSPLNPKVFFDIATPAPAVPGDSDFAAEAKRAAEHFGNTTPASNRNAQYIIATARGNNADGFGKDFCAWHTYTPSKYGLLSYTNLPYVSQAGYSCGSGLVNTPGLDDGITTVTGHEYVESATDPFPITGWVDKTHDQNEIADKCAWIDPGLPGAAINLSLTTGTFPVQSLWSNNFGTTGGCVTSYTSSTPQTNASLPGATAAAGH